DALPAYPRCDNFRCCRSTLGRTLPALWPPKGNPTLHICLCDTPRGGAIPTVACLPSHCMGGIATSGSVLQSYNRIVPISVCNPVLQAMGQTMTFSHFSVYP